MRIVNILFLKLKIKLNVSLILIKLTYLMPPHIIFHSRYCLIISKFFLGYKQNKDSFEIVNETDISFPRSVHQPFERHRGGESIPRRFISSLESIERKVSILYRDRQKPRIDRNCGQRKGGIVRDSRTNMINVLENTIKFRLRVFFNNTFDQIYV